MTRASDLAKLLGAGATINDGTTITTADNTTQLTLTSTDADASVGPVIELKRDSSSPADDDLLGNIKFSGDDDGGNSVDYTTVQVRAKDVSDGSEDGECDISTVVAGTSRSRIRMDGTETIFNENSVNLDFRVESNGNANMLFVDGGNNNVAIGHNSAGGANLAVCDGANSAIQFFAEVATDTNLIQHYDQTATAYMNARYSGATHQFLIGTSESMRIFSNGRVGLADGTTPEDAAQLDVKRNSSEIVYFRNNSGVGVKLTAGNQSFSAVSDENKKENIVELDKQQSYDNIKNIRAVTYNFRDIVKTNEDGTTTTYEDDKSRIGFISQDWETNYSQLVNTDSEGIKSLLYTETTPVLLSALQKAQEKIEALEAKVTALESA